MSRRGFHAFTSSAPVFGFDEDFYDPFYSADRAAAPRVHARAPKALSLGGDRAPDQIHERSK